MVKIVIENLAQKELSPVDPSKSILNVLQSNFIDWMHACGGKGRCTTCKMIVVEGMDLLTPLTPTEVKYRSLGQLAENERLSCQTRATGSCRIRVPEESKMPHMEYTS
jgi:ferredoxin, 2Fe-2S